MKNNYRSILITLLMLVGCVSSLYAYSPTEKKTIDTNYCNVIIKPSRTSDCIVTAYEEEAIAIRDGRYNEYITACKGSSVIYEAITNEAVRYEWTIFGAQTYRRIDNGRKVEVTWDDVSEGSVKVDVVTQDSILCSYKVYVKMSDAPHVGVMTIPSYYIDNNGNKIVEVCYGETVEFIDASRYEESPIVGYTWTSQYETSSSQNYKFTVKEIGTGETIVVTHQVVNECGCQDDEDIIIKVKPPVDFQLSCYGTVCGGSAHQYQLYKPNCSEYNWSVEGGSIVRGQNSPMILVQWGHPQTGYGTISIDGSKCETECSNLIPVKIPIISSGIEIEGIDSVCVGDLQVYELPLWGATSYDWSIVGDTNVVTYSGKTPNQYMVTFNESGVYYLKSTYECPFIQCGPYTSAMKKIVVQDRLEISSSDDVVCCNSKGVYVTNADTAVSWKVYNHRDELMYSVVTDTLEYVFTLVDNYVITATNDDYCNVSTYTVAVQDNPIALDTTYGPDHTCPSGRINVKGIPTSTRYYLQWEPICQSNVLEGDSVMIQYGDTICDINVYQIDAMTGCKSSAYVHEVQEFQLAPISHDTIYGCPKQYVSIEVPNQSSDVVYEWRMRPTAPATVLDDALIPNIDVYLNEYITPPYQVNAIVTRRYCINKERYDTIPIKVQAVEEPTIIVPNHKVCKNAMMQLSANGVSTDDSVYKWQISGHIYYGRQINANFPKVGNIVIKLIYKPENQCDSIVVQDAVEVVALPHIALRHDNQNVYLIQPTANTIYKYSFNQGAENQIYNGRFSYRGEGLYRIIAKSEVAPYCENEKVVSLEQYHGGSIRDIVLEYNKLCENKIKISAEGVPQGYAVDWVSNANITRLDNTTCMMEFEEAGHHIVSASTIIGNTQYGGSTTVQVDYVPNFAVKYNCGDSVYLEDKSKYREGYVPLEKYFYVNEDTDYIEAMPSSLSMIALPKWLFPEDTTIVVRMKFNDGYDCEVTRYFKREKLPVVNIIGPDSIWCGDTPFNFRTETQNYSNYYWDFGDSSSSTKAMVQHSYDKLGFSYKVMLTVYNKQGCSSKDSSEFDIVENPLPKVFMNIGVVCDGMPLELKYGDSYDPEMTYLWQPFGVTTNNNQYLVYHPDTYGVWVTDNVNGCKRKVSQYRAFYHKPLVRILGKSEFCFGEEVRFVGFSGNQNTYEWTITHDGVIVDIDSATNANIVFTPRNSGDYIAKLVVSSTAAGTCSDSAIITFKVHPKIPAPTIGYGGNRCIHTPPVEMKSLSGQYLYWSNGEQGEMAKYFSDGKLNAYYIDAITGCPSEKSKFIIPPAPNYETLLTGCYEMCETDMPTTMQVYGVYPWRNSSFEWNWNYGDNTVDWGDTINPKLPIDSIGIYQMESSYNGICKSESPTLTINTTPNCMCDNISVEIKEIVCNQKDCKVYFDVDLVVYNNSSDTVRFTDMVSAHEHLISNIATFPLTIMPHSYGGLYFRVDLAAYANDFGEFRLWDSKNDCYVSFVLDFDWRKCAKEAYEKPYDIQYRGDLSNIPQVAYYTIDFDFQQYSSVILLDMWSDPSQVIITPPYNAGMVEGLLMLDYGKLSQMVENYEEICLYLVVCLDGDVFYLKYCVMAEELYGFIPNGVNQAMPAMMPAQQQEMRSIQPRLLPNPVQTEVRIGNIKVDDIRTIVVYDMQGQMVMKEEETDQLQVGKLVSGSYIVCIITKTDEIYYEKLIKL